MYSAGARVSQGFADEVNLRNQDGTSAAGENQRSLSRPWQNALEAHPEHARDFDRILAIAFKEL
jgi:hypothetical protein